MYSIVIVEDELISAEYLKEVLRLHGFTVLAIIDKGEDALQKIPQLSPDIVLMDIMLKDHISGSEVALQLKQTAPDVAIVFLSAYANEEMIEYAIESNTYGYMMKPYDETRIITSLKIIISRLEKEKKSASHISLDGIIDVSHRFDFTKKRFLKDGIEVSLGEKSLNLLELLCKNPNTTVSMEQLCLKIWGEHKPISMLRTLVSRTKKESGIDSITNTKGLGYKLICKKEM